MAIPYSADLLNFQYSFRGEPFVNVISKSSITLLNFEYVWRGEPFVGNYNPPPVWTLGGAVLLIKNVPIDNGAIVKTSFLRFKSLGAGEGVTVACRILGEAADNAGAITSLADYQARRGTVAGGADNSHLTTATVLWPSMGVFVDGQAYDTPDLSPIIQEIVSRPLWVRLNSIMLFIDDLEGLNSASVAAYRKVSLFEAGGLLIPEFHCTCDQLVTV